MRRPRLADERGAVAPLVVVMLLGLLAVTALVVDGGVMFAARRDLQGLADGAARAGAMVLDVTALRQSNRVVLESGEARSAALDYLRAAGFDGEMAVAADTLSVTVDLSEDYPTVMVGLLGIRTIRTQAHAIARPRAGIDHPEG